MRLHKMRRAVRGRGKALSVLCLLVALGGCTLDEVEIPDFIGPAELGLSIRLQAIPDILTADGISTSSILATVRDQNGQPVRGRTIFFAIADESGFFADIGSLHDPLSGDLLGSRESFATTNAQGVAQVIYKAPPRTDATAHQSVLVVARPVGDDFNAQVYRSVRIELRSAEPRFFPEDPDNAAPTCSFIVEPSTGPYRTNTTILFQSTAHDNPDPGSGRTGVIVRYEWDFGDGTKSNAPDNAKVYKLPGTYTVVHTCTDDDGAQGAFTAAIPVVP